jgi:hypothetical protein
MQSLLELPEQVTFKPLSGCRDIHPQTPLSAYRAASLDDETKGVWRIRGRRKMNISAWDVRRAILGQTE